MRRVDQKLSAQHVTAASGDTAQKISEPQRFVAPPIFRQPKAAQKKVDHGGAKIDAHPAMVRAIGQKKVALLETITLRFSEPFGEGSDRHDGVRAASSILKFAGGYLIAQDDSTFAAFWKDTQINPIRLFPPQEGADTFSPARGNKKLKPDLELGVVVPLEAQPAAIFFGSGSTDKRMRAAIVREDLSAATTEIPSLYNAAMHVLGIGGAVLNLEAATEIPGGVRFFQRGNGQTGTPVNASFDLDLETLAKALNGEQQIQPQDLRNVRRYDLGFLDGAALGFSAATTLPDGRVVFVAAAEASPNTYDDGPCTGSVIGVIDKDGTVSSVAELPPGPEGPRKIEGLALESVEGKSATFRLVEDADDPTRASTAIRVRFALPAVTSTQQQEP